jgi:hypothetical protein
MALYSSSKFYAAHQGVTDHDARQAELALLLGHLLHYTFMAAKGYRLLAEALHHIPIHKPELVPKYVTNAKRQLVMMGKQGQGLLLLVANTIGYAPDVPMLEAALQDPNIIGYVSPRLDNMVQSFYGLDYDPLSTARTRLDKPPDYGMCNQCGYVGSLYAHGCTDYSPPRGFECPESVCSHRAFKIATHSVELQSAVTRARLARAQEQALAEQRAEELVSNNNRLAQLLLDCPQLLPSEKLLKAQRALLDAYNADLPAGHPEQPSAERQQQSYVQAVTNAALQRGVPPPRVPPGNPSNSAV